MNVVDSSAWLSYFAGERNAHAFALAAEFRQIKLADNIGNETGQVTFWQPI